MGVTKKISFELVRVKENYYNEYPNLENTIDEHNPVKRLNRKFLFLKIFYKDNTLLVAIRNDTTTHYKWGVVGFDIPCKSRPRAAIDYRKLLIINDSSFIESIPYHSISRSQQRIIEENLEKIKYEIKKYIDDYIIAVKKNRLKGKLTGRNSRYSDSTLVNFHKELGLISESVSP